ncbi:MAG: hypothetical protein D6812_11600 [Deltaproteobacteria bacterium]|nr:MAG: hypothetical protein D6812_11600 [Deltaproteobacteria bacterium]
MTLPAETETARITLSHPEHEGVEVSVSLDHSPQGAFLDGIEPGEGYRLSVGFLDGEGVPLVSGERTDLFIEEGLVNRVEVTLERLTGGITLGLENLEEVRSSSAQRHEVAVILLGGGGEILASRTFDAAEGDSLELSGIPTGSQHTIEVTLTGFFSGVPIELAVAEEASVGVMPGEERRLGLWLSPAVTDLVVQTFLEAERPVVIPESLRYRAWLTVEGVQGAEVLSEEAAFTIPRAPAGAALLEVVAEDGSGERFAGSGPVALLIDARHPLFLSIPLFVAGGETP